MRLTPPVVTLVAVCVAAATATTIVALHRAADANRVQQIRLARAGEEANRLDAMQTVAIKEGVIHGAVSDETFAAIRDARSQLVEGLKAMLPRAGADDARAIGAASRKLIAILDTQLRLIRERRYAQADQGDDERFDPAVEDLISTLRTEDAENAAAARAAARWADVGSVTVLVLALVGLSVLFWRFNRVQQASAVAAAAREAAERENERLLELDTLKDSFVASVSHELRTPLTSIRGYLELVREGEVGELTPEQDEFLAIVERNADRLLRLVGDLLFVAQVDAGRLALEAGEVDLTELAGDAVAAARPAAEQKAIELAVAADDVPPLNGDRARLAQLLDNLVSNALKFTPAGGRVDVRVFADDGAAVLEVTDTGMGIPAQEQERLFERFFRTSAAAAQAIQGTGLGLSIAKAVVDAHHGSITVRSAEGAGTTFRVELPVTEVAAVTEEAA